MKSLERSWEWHVLLRESKGKR